MQRIADRVRCDDCTHLWPRFRSAGRCENHRAAGLPGPWLALDFAELPQRCPGFAPKQPAQAPPTAA